MRQAWKFIGFPRRYLWALTLEMGALMGLMLLGVEALYLSDRIITKLLYEVIRDHLGMAFLIETLVLAVPEILAVGFPLAVVIAVYITLLRRRDAGDFVILSGAGLGPLALVFTLGGLGLVLLALWGPFRAYVEPMAARALSIRLDEGRFEAVQRGTLIDGQFLQLGAATFFKHPPAAGNPTDSGAIFVYLTPTEANEQVATASTVLVHYTPGAPTATMDLTEAQVLGLRRTEGQTRLQTHWLAVDHMRLTAVPMEITDLTEVLAQPRAATLPQLMQRWRRGEAAAGQAALERLLGIGLAALAPLMAGLALAMTRERMTLLALPGGLGVVLGAGLAITPVARVLLLLGPVGAPIAAGLCFLASGFGIAALLFRQIPGAILPQRLLK